MANQVTVLQVFVASPGDVHEERELLAEVIEEFNRTWGKTHKVYLELLRWETHSFPSIGNGGQDVINQQIGDDYDVFIGIMWGRFGSKTKKFDSGSEEEFHRAYDRYSRISGSIEIMLYFKEAGIAPKDMDLEQLGKIESFKSKVSKECGALYHTFETSNQFRDSVRVHLSRVVQSWINKNGKLVETEDKHPVLETEIRNPLANLTAIDSSDDIGLFELTDEAVDSMDEVVLILGRMAEIITDLGNKTRLRTKELEDYRSEPSDRKVAKRLINKSADDFEMFVKRMSTEIQEFDTYNTRAMDSFGKIAMMSNSETHEDFSEALSGLTSYRESASQALVQIADFRTTVEEMPRATTALNRSRKRAVAVLDDLITQLHICVSSAADVEKMLDDIGDDSLLIDV